jgi:serine protease Do
MIFLTLGHAAFAQSAAAVRDYVCLINQNYHPDIVEYMNKIRERLEKNGETDGVKAIDAIIKGKGGSGFIYVDQGANYVITNNHVVTQSYTLSATFEKTNGTKTKYDNLSLLYVDEENDMAILAFPKGENPFREGMAFAARAAEEGETVFSAGFPGLVNTQLWQFGQGIVSNASARFPDPDNEEKTMGPYIQHTAQVDPGNSGGPLLMAQGGAPSGYAVVGINTLSVRNRQASNFAIPEDRVKGFLSKALGEAPGDGKKDLEERIDSFLDGLGANRAVYPHIAKYVSSVCTAQNTEFCLDEMFEKASRTVQRNIMKTFASDPVAGMQEAVAWVMENTLRGGSTKIQASVDSITENSQGGFTVTFAMNGATVESEWIKEFGIWRINSFGELVKGDKSLITAKEEAREQEKNLKTDYHLMLSLSYAQILDRGAAGNAELKLKGDYTGWVISGFYAGSDFFQVQTGLTIEVPIRFGSAGFALIPFIEGGIGMMEKKNEQPDSWLSSSADSKIRKIMSEIQGGLLFTTSALPGVYVKAVYQKNFYSNSSDDLAPKPDKTIILVGLGYVF